MSAALYERDGHVLAVHRGDARPPFAGQWLPPMTVVRENEAAEDALRRHAVEQFGVTVRVEQFLDTVYVQDPQDGARYVVNMFRAPIAGGPLRFDAAGDYDDARWLTAAELDQLIMPAALHDALVRILAGQPEPPAGEAMPLAEQPAPETPAPDNSAGWDAIARAYQDERYGERDAGRLKWTWGVFEDDLRLLDEVRGQRAIVLGCGGGQDCVALAAMGAVAVGIDISAEQIAYAKRYAARHRADNASFVQGSIEDLSRFDDESFDLAVSIHALGYVERADVALREAARVLRPDGVFAMTVSHPFNHVVSDGPPYVIERSYWQRTADWEWRFENGAQARFRDYPRTISEWFSLLTEAGFAVERMEESYMGEITGDDARALDMELARLLPYALIIKARKR